MIEKSGHDLMWPLTQLVNTFEMKTSDSQVQIPKDPFLPAGIKNLIITRGPVHLPQFGNMQQCSAITSHYNQQETPV